MKKQRLITIQLHTDMDDLQMEWLADELADGWRIASVSTTGGCTPAVRTDRDIDYEDDDERPASAWIVVVLEREDRH